MSLKKQPLNERQLAVLQWVGKGCPPGVWESTSYKTSCLALQNRNLVKITRTRDTWSAALTDNGRHYLAHGSYPALEPTRHTARRQPPLTTTPATALASPTSKPAAPAPFPRGTRKTFTEQLLDELAQSGGRIIKSGQAGDTEKWPSRLAAARRSGRVPGTKELYGRWCREGYEITLVDVPAWRLATLEPVPVPARLTRPHAVVAAMQKERQPLGLPRAVQGRALRLIHALATALEAQGDTCEAGSVDSAPPIRRRRHAAAHFTATAQGQTVAFLVFQEQDRSEHTATERELAEAKKYSWVKIPKYDYTPSDRLRFVLDGGSPHRASEWADSTERPLEEQLAEIVQEVALRGAAAERKRLAEREAAQQQKLRWEAAMQEARVQHAETFRVQHFEAQEAAWRRATHLTEYLDAVRSHVHELPPGPTRTDAESWLSWASGYVARLDPTNQPPRLPEIPEPRAEDLKPFLRDWSPYGPYLR
ncbi:hypothetical protein [Streptomyces clavuligerus]|uniref:PE-PGRS family protein n=2 Tax=Streptomyces clavuligerus TaxID=1901 RepID=E2Q0C6_STRCL|nr:hypothetical protein [Streptomyces clavuligerus]AXU11532.1 hypothetical protein D1794_01595 [Streptomyces clavuligerus]EFG10469.1 Hypothetical protein SCLAV_5402 [Streptomyces clavuligerus]MBY6301352.1 hypothetical protein [Streptomyces clavuligerus]QCS04404.1 hypothetical protein CRV15_01595 [Streptomyces clavuligerus]QPJ96212.1 hypothetical protein GE265_26275 [Streptomyces clavuligerus]